MHGGRVDHTWSIMLRNSVSSTGINIFKGLNVRQNDNPSPHYIISQSCAANHCTLPWSPPMLLSRMPEDGLPIWHCKQSARTLPYFAVHWQPSYQRAKQLGHRRLGQITDGFIFTGPSSLPCAGSFTLKDDVSWQIAGDQAINLLIPHSHHSNLPPSKYADVLH